MASLRPLVDHQLIGGRCTPSDGLSRPVLMVISLLASRGNHACFPGALLFDPTPAESAQVGVVRSTLLAIKSPLQAVVGVWW